MSLSGLLLAGEDVPLRAFDAGHGGALVETLRAYLAATRLDAG